MSPLDRVQAEQSANADESWTTKLWRETEVFGKGTVRGFSKGAQEAKEDFWHTAANAGISFGIGAGLALAPRGPGIFKLGAALVGAEMTLATANEMLTSNRPTQAKKIWLDTWKSKDNQESNINAAADTVGRFAFDSSLMLASGALGAGLGSALRPHQLAPSKFIVSNKIDGYPVRSDIFEGGFQPDFQLTRLAARISKVEKIPAMTFRVPTEVAHPPFLDVADYLARATKEITVPVREYSVSGLSTKILVPEEYAANLDQVRALRIESEKPGFFNRWSRDRASSSLSDHPYYGYKLPEEFIPTLEHTPDNTVVKRLLVVEWQGAFYHYFKAAHEHMGSGGFDAKAWANTAGDITFVKPFMHTDDSLVMNHEWAHLLKWQNNNLSDAFEAAMYLDKTPFVLNSHARINADENWAVHLAEGILNSSRNVFKETTINAPVRSAVMGRGLSDILHATPAERRSPQHDFYSQRAEYIREHVTPDVVKTLGQTAEMSEEEKAMAAKLIEYLGG